MSGTQTHRGDRGRHGNHDSDNGAVLHKPPFRCLRVSADISDIWPGERERDRYVNDVEIASVSKVEYMATTMVFGG